MTEGRRPPDDDFEWSDAPVQPRRRGPDPDAFNTGERDSFRPPPEPEPTPPEPAEREPLDPGEGAPERDPSEALKRSYAGDPFTTTEERPPLRRRKRGRRERDERRRRGDTGGYERQGRRSPPGRRVRRSDLPAGVRRRQDIAVGAVVIAVLAGGVLLLSGGGGGASQGQSFPVKKLVGQTIVGKMGPGGPDKQMLKQVRAGMLGNLIVLPHDASSLKRDIARVQKAAREGGNPPLLIMIDQEGGYVKRLPGPPNTSPNEFGRSGDANAAKAEGQSTGSFLASLGVNVNLAPLLDVTTPHTADTIASRTYGSDEATVAAVGTGFIEGLQASGVAATAKHFPGLGLSTVNTDFGASTVSATPAEQDAALAPFKAAIDAGVDLVMVSTAVYPNLGSQDPAALSSAIVNGQLRSKLGFKGPIVTDDLEARSITDVMSPERAAVAAIKAGDDLLLFAHRVNTAGSAFQAIVKAAKAGRLDQAALQAAYRQVLALKRSLANDRGHSAAG